MSETNNLINLEDIQILSLQFEYKEVWRISDLSVAYWRLMHNNKGISELFFKNNRESRRLSLPKSVIVLVPPGIEYSCSNASPVEHMEINFNILGPPLSTQESYLTFPFVGESQTFIEKIQKVSCEMNSHLPIEFILYLLNHSNSMKAIHSATGDNRLNKSVVLMKQNPGNPLSNSHLAEESLMSVNGFARLFREKMGCTPYAYQMKLRIEKACIALQYTDKTIEVIAVEAGFTNRFHFSKAFKKMQNKTPVQFRTLQK